MITGYNTDVEFAGVVYHVQTEDKGVESPVIVTLVYAGGAILASKRSPYNDLITRGLDSEELTKRLQRQHKLICAAVHAGRIEDLKQMSRRESSQTGSGDVTSVAESKVQEPESVGPTTAASERPTGEFSSPPTIDESARLSIRLLEEPDLRGGRSVTLRLLVLRTTEVGGQGASGVPVTVKTLGTSFSPQSTQSITDDRGMAVISLSLPNFKSGRAAILIHAHANGETAELRRIILPVGP